jgi:predicted alpha/beta hydrolase family esterase
VCENFPDPNQARRDIWIPFIRSKAEQASASDPSNVILVGHSSGAQAALRYSELYPVKAAVLVSATFTDLGDAYERASGYYPQQDKDGNITNAYDFDSMKANCPTWHQFHSDDDPFIPLREAEQIRDGLGLTDTYHMLPGRSHFFEYFPELVELVSSLC